MTTTLSLLLSLMCLVSLPSYASIYDQTAAKECMLMLSSKLPGRVGQSVQRALFARDYLTAVLKESDRRTNSNLTENLKSEISLGEIINSVDTAVHRTWKFLTAVGNLNTYAPLVGVSPRYEIPIEYGPVSFQFKLPAESFFWNELAGLSSDLVLAVDPVVLQLGSDDMFHPLHDAMAKGDAVLSLKLRTYPNDRNALEEITGLGKLLDVALAKAGYPHITVNYRISHWSEIENEIYRDVADLRFNVAGANHNGEYLKATLIVLHVLTAPDSFHTGADLMKRFDELGRAFADNVGY